MNIQLVKTSDTLVLVFSDFADTNKAEIFGSGSHREQTPVEVMIHLMRALKDENYHFFRAQFGLADDDNTLMGYTKLGCSYISDTPGLSVRLLNILEEAGMRIFLDSCLKTKEEVRSLRNFGDKMLAELESKISEVSGLELRWK